MATPIDTLLSLPRKDDDLIDLAGQRELRARLTAMAAKIEADQNTREKIILAVAEIYERCKRTVTGKLRKGESPVVIATMFGASIASLSSDPRGNACSADALRNGMAQILVKFGIDLDEIKRDKRVYWCLVRHTGGCKYPPYQPPVKFMNADEFFPAANKWIEDRATHIVSRFKLATDNVSDYKIGCDETDECLIDSINAKLIAAGLYYKVSLWDHYSTSGADNREQKRVAMHFNRMKVRRVENNATSAAAARRNAPEHGPFSQIKDKIMIQARAQKRRLDQEAETSRKKVEEIERLQREADERRELFVSLAPPGLGARLSSDKSNVLSALQIVYAHCKAVVAGDFGRMISPVGMLPPVPFRTGEPIFGSGTMVSYCVDQNQNYVTFAVKHVLKRLGISLKVMEFHDKVYWVFSQKLAAADSPEAEPPLRVMNGREFGGVLKKWVDARMAVISAMWSANTARFATDVVACEESDKLLVPAINAELRRQGIPCVVSFVHKNWSKHVPDEPGLKFTVDCELLDSQ